MRSSSTEVLRPVESCQLRDVAVALQRGLVLQVFLWP